MKHFEGERFDNGFHDYRSKHTGNRKCLSSPICIKDISNVHFYNNCYNQIIKPDIFSLPIANLKVQGAIP